MAGNRNGLKYCRNKNVFEMNVEFNIIDTLHMNSDKFLSDGSSISVQTQLLIDIGRKLIFTITPFSASTMFPLLDFLSYDCSLSVSVHSSLIVVHV